MTYETLTDEQALLLAQKHFESDSEALADGEALELDYPVGYLSAVWAIEDDFRELGYDPASFASTALKDAEEQVVTRYRELVQRAAREQEAKDRYKAMHRTDGWCVEDTHHGGIWWPHEDAQAEIAVARDPEAAAVWMCAESPMRGRWEA